MPALSTLKQLIPLLLLALSLLTGCQKRLLISLTGDNKNKVIAIQPFYPYFDSQLSQLKDSLADFFNMQVIVLEPIEIPKSSLQSSWRRYNADSLLHYLLKVKRDSTPVVVGITNREIYQLQADVIKRGIKGARNYKEIGIYGLGFISKGACIVSSYKLGAHDDAISASRLRKVTIHEIGHNLGLQHCGNHACLMSEVEGNTVAELDQMNEEFCKRCRKSVE